MSLFTDLDIPLGPNDQVVSVSVSNVYHNPSVAVMTPQKILLFNESGEKHDYELSRNFSPSYICWHPHLPQIAIGWLNGTVTLWNEENKMAKEEMNVHKDKISIIAFSPSGQRMVTADIRGLVAVWRGINCIATYKKEGVISHCIFADLSAETKIRASNLFLFGGQSGKVCLADDAKHCSDVCKVGGSIKSLLFYQKENSVIIITSTLLLVQFKISSSNEQSGPDKKVRLSIAGEAEKLRSIWIGNQLLATVSFENMIRMWHLEEDDNYALTLSDMQTDEGDNLLQDKISCSIYEQKGRVLVAGTNKGNLIFWKNNSISQDSPKEPESWKPMPYIPFEQQINALDVGKNNGVIAVHFGNEVALISETIIKGKLSNTVKLLQTSADRVQIYYQNDMHKQMVLFDSKEATIKGLDCTDTHMLIWTNKKIEIHEIVAGLKETSTKLVHQFNEKCYKIALYKENVILVQNYGIGVATYEGVMKQNVTFSESEGKINNIDIMGQYMVLWTSNNYIRIFDLSRREIKQIGISRRFENSSGPLGRIRNCTINSNGQKVVIIADPIKKNVNDDDNLGKFFIYDVEMDNFLSYELDYDTVPLDAYYDHQDKRFFGVLVNSQKSAKTEAKNVDHTQVLDFHQQTQENGKKDEEYEQSSLKLLTFFVTSENGIKKQDEYVLDQDVEGVFALKIPYIYQIKRNQSNDPSNNYQISEMFMSDFEGLEGEIDDIIKSAIMNFSFFLSTGNLDEAYKSVKSIQKPQVWEKMAAMSVKMRRIDVAEICLGNMRFARGARAIREAKKEPELQAQLAMVAVQLNMKEQAVKLYEESKRFDLLNQMYQADGQWDKAITMSEKHDRMNLKNTHFKRAKFYEISKNFDEAITHYEHAGVHVKEVPRMLLESNEIEMLEDYVLEKNEKELFQFWAQYLESTNRFEQAAQFYKKADDTASIVRILCHKKDFAAAKQLCQENSMQKADPAACYYLAKQLELAGAIVEAIQYYKQSQHFSQASKLARQQQMDQEVMVIALQASNQIKLLSASYFEEKKFIDKAFELYKKGKNYSKAKEIAKKHLGQNEIQEIERLMGQQQSNTNLGSDQINEGDLPSHQAIPLMIRQKKYEEALKLVIETNTPMTDDLLRQIISEDLPDFKKKQMRSDVAEHLKIQGNYALATQQFIKIGDTTSAMKCLINLGNVDKVIKFASQARKDEIYILAANFLQTTDWNTNPEMMKHIISFYNKAKAYDHLAGFFDACSQVEIDEYRDYDKAIAALKEALKHANRSTSAEKDNKIQALQQKIFIIEKFIQARNVGQQNPSEMISQCEQLLQNPNIEQALRAGDIYAHIVEFYYQQRNFEQAFNYVQKMQQAKIVLNPYLDSAMLQQIYEQVGHNPNQQQQQQQYSNNNINNNNNNNNNDDGEQFQEEELIDEDLEY